MQSSCVSFIFFSLFLFQDKEEYRQRSSSTASGTGRGGGREEYGRHFERGREIGGGRSDKLPPRRQDDWKCLEVN